MKYTIKDWDKPKSGTYLIIIDSYWAVDDNGNPLFLTETGRFPQCNDNPDIALRIANGRPIKKLFIVYVPIEN